MNNSNFYDKNYLFVGGHYNTLNKLKNEFPNAKFVAKPSDKVDKDVDAIVFLTSFTNHNIYSKVRNKYHSTPYIHTTHSGTEYIINEMEDKLKIS